MKKLIIIIFIGLFSFGGNWLYSVFRGIPTPYIQDELSYLLAADTFAHGRVTNPTHPLWRHFETFYELQQPTYMSKYPPAQGFFMAAGQVIFGHPIYGVWLSNSLMCMAVCWMLYAWVPSYWAFIGGIVSVLQFGMFIYWSHSYWGGAVAALGAALVYGALPRIFRYQRLRDVIWLGLGVAVLVNSRPLEGLFMAIPVGCLVLPWKIKWEKIRNACFVKKIVVPFILILVIIIIGMGSYNKAVTGKATLFPYVLCLKQQMAIPMLIWQPLSPPKLMIPITSHYMKDGSTQYYLDKRTWKGFWIDESNDIQRIFTFYFRYVLAVPVLFFLLNFLRNRQRAFKFLLAVMIIAGTCAVMPSMALWHYFSPLTALVILLIVSGLRTMACLWKHQSIKLVYVLIAIQAMTNVIIFADPGRIDSYGIPAQGQGLAFEYYTRKQFADILVQKGGKHLVLIDYDPDQYFLNEWVYNSADIDQQPIVWARSINPWEDAKIIAYYKNRQVWRVKVDRESYGNEFQR